MWVLCLLVCAVSGPPARPVLPPSYTVKDADSLRKNVSVALALSPEEIYNLVPTQSGIYFCGCPNCDGGAHEANVLVWEPGMGDSVKCRYCGMTFPNDRFPENQEQVLMAPSGARHVYRWFETDEGRQFHFQGRALYDRYVWCERMAHLMANLYALTGDTACGDRAAIIVGRFAQVFPDYAVRYSYPFRPVRFFPADQKYPYEGLNEPYRGAKLYWWAYCDIPATLARAYDLLAAGDSFDRMRGILGEDIEERIENDLIRLGYEFTTANPDSHDNMMPCTYHDMVIAGRVLNEPAMVHETLQRFKDLIQASFTFDGWWREGAPSYHWQAVNALNRVADVARGYTDPPEWEGPRFENLEPAAAVPMLAKARQTGEQGVLPDGRLIPINDTWSSDRRTPPSTSVSRLWSGMGHAVLGTGDDQDQFQLHLNWSGAYGHAHADNASVILRACGTELASDIGYTHTRYRNWTLNTASHNTVVVDSRSQTIGTKESPSTGNLLFYDDHDPRVQVIDVDASPAYPNCSVYRRRLAHVHIADGRDYVVDLFDVEGGESHDYFLHGSADESGALEVGIPLPQKISSLVPEWGGTQEYTGENCLDLSGERFHPYWFLWDIRAGEAEGEVQATWVYSEAGLRLHAFVEPDSMVVRFSSPAIRPAGEDDRRLLDSLRHGLMIRHRNNRSCFAAVLEPFRKTPWIKSATFQGDCFVVRHDFSEETIAWDANRLVIRSSAGWEYDSGTPRNGRLLAVERGESFAFQTDLPPLQARFARVIFGTGSTGYRIRTEENGRLCLGDDPGFEYDPRQRVARFLYFPHAVFEGEPMIAVYAQ